MTFSYRHTQIGYLMIGVLAAGVVGLSASIVFGNGPKALAGVITVLGLCLLLFPTLTVVVQGDRLRCFFGLGLIRREISLAEILAVAVVRNPWSYGWGLRLIPGGWLWNVSGFDAVELRLQNGKLFRIGTDEPEALHAALANALKAG
ncbi:hypothetical protein EIZ87_24680 [Escherichia coli]|uniref:hypothetical protein n=1 Tax=Escherichia coli TaxID=562 RepID=UPI00128EA4D1|nr:hypothetical protein [Escherichia coli]MQK65865.1 hypothetical protein [Escherichia coli]